MHFGFLPLEVSPTSRPSVRAQFLQVPFSSALGMSHPSLPPESLLSLPFPKASVKKQFDISVYESRVQRRQGLGSDRLFSSATQRTQCFTTLHVPVLANSFLLTQQHLTEKQLSLHGSRGGVGKHQSDQMPAGWGVLLPGDWMPAGCWVPLRGVGWAGWLLSDAPANSPCEQHLLLVHLYLIFSLVHLLLVHFLLMHRYSFFCVMHLLLVHLLFIYLFIFCCCTSC